MQYTEAGVAIAWRRRVERTHTLPERKELPEIGMDCCSFGRGGEDVLPILCVKRRNSSTGCLGATVVDSIHQESGVQENSGENV